MQGKKRKGAKKLADGVLWVYKENRQLKLEDFVFPYGKLNPENKWIQLSELIPWDRIEERYSGKFENNGHPAHPARMALGALLIVALCDKLSNMRQMKRDYDKLGDKMWRKFNQKNKAEHAWYYKSIQHILLKQLGDTTAFQECAELIRHVFHENEGGMEYETGRGIN